MGRTLPPPPMTPSDAPAAHSNAARDSLRSPARRKTTDRPPPMVRTTPPLSTTPPPGASWQVPSSTGPPERQRRTTPVLGMAPALAQGGSGAPPVAGGDEDPFDLEAVRARVVLLRDNIVAIREVGAPTLRHVEAMFDRISEVTRGLERFPLLVDLTEASRPTAELRAALRGRLRLEESRLSHVAIFTGENFLVSIAVQFVMRGQHVRSFSVHRTREQALEAIRRNASEQG